MYIEDIPCYMLFGEVEQSVTNTVLAVCDAAEFLGSDMYGLKDIYDLYGTKYEDIIPAFLYCRHGESDGGMWGNLFRFQLTEPLKKHILEESLICIFGDEKTVLLENLALFQDDKCLFSCVSHEVFSLYHMAEVDDSLKDVVLSAVNDTIKKMPLYGQMQKIAAGLQHKAKSELKKEMRILLDLCWYVDAAVHYFVYTEPSCPCDFLKFRQIAKSYLTEETYSVLIPLNNFADLQPLPVPKTADDVIYNREKFAPQYLQSEYYKQVARELGLLEYIMRL